MADRVSQTPELPRNAPGGDARGPFLSLVSAASRILTQHAVRLNGSLQASGEEAMLGPLQLASFTLATLPVAAEYPYGIVVVTDAPAGTRVQVSDGAAWQAVSAW